MQTDEFLVTMKSFRGIAFIHFALKLSLFGKEKVDTILLGLYIYPIWHPTMKHERVIIHYSKILNHNFIKRNIIKKICFDKYKITYFYNVIIKYETKMQSRKITLILILQSYIIIL